MKIVNDTLKTAGKWSMKRVSAFFAFWLAVVYEFGGAVLKLETKEYVFEGLMTWAAVVIIGSIADKKLINRNPPKPDEEIS